MAKTYYLREMLRIWIQYLAIAICAIPCGILGYFLIQSGYPYRLVLFTSVLFAIILGVLLSKALADLIFPKRAGAGSSSETSFVEELKRFPKRAKAAFGISSLIFAIFLFLAYWKGGDDVTGSKTLKMGIAAGMSAVFIYFVDSVIGIVYSLVSQPFDFENDAVIRNARGRFHLIAENRIRELK